MSSPLLGIAPLHPEKTLLLGQVFNDTAASYKFFWLLSLLTLLQQNKKGIFGQREIIEEMVIAAWHPVCFYRLSLGAQDNLQHTVTNLKSETSLENDATAVQIRPHLTSSVTIRNRLQSLANLVPTRFLSPWFASQLRGVDGHVRTSRIKELATMSQKSSQPSPYFFEYVGNETRIHLNESWAVFFNQNLEVVRSFVLFHLCRYLQVRNPNVPGIVNKLSAPTKRALGPARRFWTAVHSEFNRTRRGQLFHDIYSGAPLDRSFSIDHFLPWAFVAHDLLWNLAPVAATTNSIKCDSLPDPDLYVPRLSRLHRESLLAMRDKPAILEDYANWFMADINGIASMPEEQFFEHYRESIEPQIQIASNQGFPMNWVFSGREARLAADHREVRPH